MIPRLVSALTADRVEATSRRTVQNRLWVSDLTYVATWRGSVYAAFAIDAFSRRIVGWRVSNSLKSDLAYGTTTVESLLPC